MSDAVRRKALQDARRAQADFDRQVEKARVARRKSFERAQKAGFSLREIGEEVGLHHTRVGQIIRGR